MVYTHHGIKYWTLEYDHELCAFSCYEVKTTKLVSYDEDYDYVFPLWNERAGPSFLYTYEEICNYHFVVVCGDNHVEKRPVSNFAIKYENSLVYESMV
jgi:hypothetical protein